MAEVILSLDHVGDSENVARVIFSPSYIYKGRVAPTAFKWDILPSGDAEDYISVLREDGRDLSELTKSFKPRVEGDKRYGYALLNAGDIRSISDSKLLEEDTRVDVLPYPSKRYANHAGIKMMVKGITVTALSPISTEIMTVQKELAMKCSEIVPFMY